MSQDGQVKRYFSDKADAWLKHAYVDSGYNYPTAPHRNRITLRELARKFSDIGCSLIDVGCGDGSLCVAAAEAGYHAHGVDQSEQMIGHARAAACESNETARSRLQFTLSPFDVLNQRFAADSFDALSAMGFIGYLSDDSGFFRTAAHLLKPGGALIVSCRNRLMNMTSVSPYTRLEIENGTALALIDELDELYQEIGAEQTKEFMQRLDDAVEQLRTLNPDGEMIGEDPATVGLTVQARQHTPRQLAREAGLHGFAHQRNFGVHPHLLAPRLNRLLPPYVFNRVSDALVAFEALPVSLVWSSIFISLFEKQ